MDVQMVVREALGAVLGPSAASLPGGADLAAHGLTSVQAIEVVFALEDRLGVEIPDDRITRDTFRSIDALVQTLQAVSGG
jgi:acyl carrier protein